MITVYFDGACGLCSREIAHYRKIAPAGVFDWRDISLNKDALQDIAVSHADALRYLHVRDAAGDVHIGVNAFIAIWRRLPGWRRLAPLIGAPVIRPICAWFYRRFANWRFRRLSHCQIAAAAEARD